MNILKKSVIITIVLAITTILILGCYSETINTNLNITTGTPANVGVLLYSFDDIFTALLKEKMEEVEKENPDKIKFTFFDGKGNLSVQQELMQKIIQMNFDLIISTFDDRKEGIIEDIISKVKQKNIPLIFFNSTIKNPAVINGYKKALIINTNVEQSGVQQGNLLVSAWNTNKQSLDKNSDNIMQYIILKGNPASYSAEVRTKSVIETINNAGIKTEQLASVVSNWEKESAKTAISSLFLRYGNKIEVIISNNDAMAIGAIEALQNYGYNLGNKSKTIAVVGIDAIPAAQELIKKGAMLGSVIQDPRIMAETMYKVGMNLIAGRNPVEGTDYKFDETGVKIILPYQEFPIKSIPQILIVTSTL